MIEGFLFLAEIFPTNSVHEEYSNPRNHYISSCVLLIYGFICTAKEIEFYYTKFLVAAFTACLHAELIGVERKIL